LKVQRDGRSFTVDVTADGEGLISHAGTALLAWMADRLGLTAALSEGLSDIRARRGLHDPGRVVRDLAVTLADGGECLADIGGMREQASLFGLIASDSTAWRTIAAIAAEPERLEAIRCARKAARERAWKAGAAPAKPRIDLDAALIGADSEKEGAAGDFKGGFGFHPMLAYLDESQEALAAELRPGNAGANTAADQIAVAEAALEQLPAEVAAEAEIVLRTDSAGASHELLDWCREGKIGFTVGYKLSEAVREAVLALPERIWAPALTQEGEGKNGAWVAELTGALDLSAWPEGSRLIVRRERPHPGAQLSFSDTDGHRFQAILTDQAGEAAEIERTHRARARVEDRIRCAKETGMRKLPFSDFQMNAVWLELVLMAQDLFAWANALLLRGALSNLEPKRLRHRALHTAGRLAFSGRRAMLRLPRNWPWATELLAAFERLALLPEPAG
jgi:Transposase DDE domain group 1